MIKRNKQNYQSVRIKHQKISHVLLTENLCSQQTNGESSVLSHGIKLRWKRPTGHCRGPTTNNQKNLIIRAGLRGGQRWQLPRDPRWKGPPPWWNLFVSNKILVWKIPWFRSDAMLR